MFAFEIAARAAVDIVPHRRAEGADAVAVKK
jgi:hypothetical protein